VPNLPDLLEYLKTGKSPKYDGEVILGRWMFDMSGALNLVKRNNPKIAFQEMTRTKFMMSRSLVNASFVATPEPERLAVLKGLSKVKLSTNPKVAPTVEPESTFKGTWTGDNGKYQLSFPDKASRGSLEAVVDGDKMTVSGDLYPMVFSRVY
jgi:hypothetical protein